VFKTTAAADMAAMANGAFLFADFPGNALIPQTTSLAATATLTKDTVAGATDLREQDNMCASTLTGIGGGIKIDVRNYATHATFGNNGPATTVRIINNSESTPADVYGQLIYADGTYGAWGKLADLKPREVVAEFDSYLHDELDLMREAANASQLRRNFANSDKLMIPEMIWDLCHTNVIVMERMYGISIGKTKELRAAGVDFKKLAVDGVEIFFTQVFEYGFFHADMHPGNILVSLDPKTFGRYISLDFGIVGNLSEFDKNYLAQNFLAFFNRDYRRVAELHIESGWVPENTRLEELEGAVRTVCEPYFDRPLKDISLGIVLMRLFQTSRRFKVEIQPQLTLLQKTLLNVEGLGRQLDPVL
jgi:hypothetical protein